MQTTTTTKEAIEKIEAHIEKYRRIAVSKNLMSANETLPKPSYKLRGRVAGYGSSNYLAFNLVIATMNDINHFCEDTVPHEIAHVIQRRLYPYSKSHGPEWKRICVELTGKKLDRCHQMVTVSARKVSKVDFTCGCRHYKLTTIRANRIKNGRKYICRTCKNVLTPLE
jgi:SprT protein